MKTCVHGHELTPDNVYTYPSSGRKVCLTCRRKSARDSARRRNRTPVENWRMP